MTSRAIIFSGDSVRATLHGLKRETRRVFKFPAWADPSHQIEFSGVGGLAAALCEASGCFADVPCPYGIAGDELWARETWRTEELGDDAEVPGLDGVRFKSDDRFEPIANTVEAAEAWGAAHRRGGKWRSPIHMPRWASRLTLTVIMIRVERLHEIREAGALAEGMIVGGNPRRHWYHAPDTARMNFQTHWDKINAARGFSWDTNPWVWVVTFKRKEEASGARP